ncbi:MAG: TIGR00730 family Rossman fold protein [Paludibacteraceae bacterium]|nr:TIGR00730 family Rossman fold protein [Paludibacteraceae bacterium]MBR2451503.1 TIGR00730 family Rossman fold protein [Paludibacteraceae bacterium]
MKIAVYCSAKDRIPEDYLALGDVLGKWIAQAGHTLVYGGATGGLMTRVSNAAKAASGTVEGVIPQRIIQAKRMANNCDTLHIVENMCERKQKMKELADCFVCLPGSYGTMDEMMDVVASGTVDEHRKPIFVLNYKGFYEGLKQQAEHMRTLAFLPQQEQYAPQFVDTMDELINHLESLKL